MEIIGGIIAILLACAGLVGSIIPLLPSTPLILGAGIIYALSTGFSSIGWGTLTWLTILTIFSQLLDYVATVYGAKKLGAGRWGTTGAFIGGIIGMFFGIIGILIGPILGAFLGEFLLSGKNTHDSLRSGFGAFLGFLGGTAGKLVIAIIMCGILLWSIAR